MKVQTKLSLLGYHLKLFLFECHNGMMFLLNDIGIKLSVYLVPVFENTENTILVFSKNCSCYSNLVFSMFFITKKMEPNVFCVFLLLFVFQNKKQFSNTVNKRILNFHLPDILGDIGETVLLVGL